MGVADGIESHKRGEVVMDPCTHKRVGPLCISRIAKEDKRRRTAMQCLAHFPLRTVQKLKNNGVDPDFMLRKAQSLAYGTAVMMVACMVMAFSTTWLLNDNAWGWVPIFAFIFSGGMIVFVYLFFKILNQ